MLTYHILNADFQYLKCLLISFLISTYNILKIYNGPAQFEMVSQRDRLSQEFVIGHNYNDNRRTPLASHQSKIKVQ